MISYEDRALRELNDWKSIMKKKPSIIEKATKGVQRKFNSMLPVKYHEIITSSIKNLTKAVLYGSQSTTKPPIKNLSLAEREELVKGKTKFYTATAVIEGAATGAGGIILVLTDFPLLLSIKIKFLYDVAIIYGFDVNEYSERLFQVRVALIRFLKE